MVDIAVIQGQRGTSPASVDAAQVIESLRSQGVVLFKGFDCGHDEFVDLTHRYSKRHTCDPSKVSGGRLQTMPGRVGNLGRLASRLMTKGSDAVGMSNQDDGTRVAPVDGYGLNPHNENTFIPGADPDLVWFFCATAATDGGSTLLCDGQTLLEAISERAQDFASSTLVRYELTLQRAQWQAVYDVVEIEQLTALLEPIQGVSFDLSRSGALHYVFETDQAGTALFDGEAVLSSNVLSRRSFGEVGGNEMERLASGDPLPAWFVQELLEAVADHQVWLDLEPADVIMIDNTRVMHGRTPFTDLRRRVFTRCSWLDPALLPAA